MQLFYQKDLHYNLNEIQLEEATSKHLIQVLRMKIGQEIEVTDGKGNVIVAKIIDDNRKRVVVQKISSYSLEAQTPKLIMAICFTKNRSRNEWMLEKMTELGVHTIVPIIAQRSEKEKWNQDRMENILLAAMLQSKQYFIPILQEPILLEKFIAKQLSPDYNLLVAHCENDQDKNILIKEIKIGENTCIFIGPEGDFTPNEIATLKKHNAKPISLGANRLRTETAAVYACTIFNALNYA